MTEAFWRGVIAGYGIAIPVGAIAVLIVDTGLRRGFTFGLMAGIGAATADFLYALLAAIAGEVLASALAPYALGLRFAAALVLLALAGSGIWRGRRTRRRQQEAPRAAPSGGRFRTFLQFLGLTLLNPLTITYFGALILGGDTGAGVNNASLAAFVFGAGLASFSWQTLLAAVGALARKHLSPRFQRSTSLVGNLIVLLLGLQLLSPLFLRP